jgi:hypothetical protein
MKFQWKLYSKFTSLVMLLQRQANVLGAKKSENVHNSNVYIDVTLVPIPSLKILRRVGLLLGNDCKISYYTIAPAM